MKRAPTLRGRVAKAILAFTALVCAVYGALAFLFVYVVEDEFFAALLENEAAHVTTDPAARPRLPFVTIHHDWNDVPGEVREGGTPRAREVAGKDGRHYHVRRVSLPSGDAWLVGEVSSLLVVRPMRAKLLTILLPATVLILIGSSVVAELLARRSVRQLTALVEAVEQNRAPRPGQLHSEVTDHEVGVLAQSLEDALSRVHALLQREKAFVGDVSHELRTPVAVIRGAAELLDRRPLDETAAAQVRRIREAARSAEAIIQLLLALAREETAREESTSIPLLAVVEKLVVRQAELPGGRETDIRIDIAPDTRVVAPPAATEIVLSNLISNALRHGAGGITIIGSDKEVTISDRGPGLDLDGGSRGIGLNLVRRLCEVCGFDLRFQSSERGTAASVSFSAGPAEAGVTDRGRRTARTAGGGS